MKVLVVIDVQNCFMFHKDGERGGTFLNVEKEKVSKDIIDELETLVDDKTHVVFSRDFHPVNHISLEGYEGRRIDALKGVWPKHCRNKGVQCGARAFDYKDPSLPNNVVDTDTGELTIVNEGTSSQRGGGESIDVIGTELSYMFFKSEKLKGPVKELIKKNREGKNKIGLGDTMVETNDASSEMKEAPEDSERTVNYDELPLDGKYITLTKGERCDKEAYSAFNYHIVYDSSDPANPVKSNIIPNDAANSTGLWEWILKNRNGANEITITVCGLVGNVCVMHSLLQGIALWNNIYSRQEQNQGISVKFVYSLQGTRFAKDVPEGMPVKPESFDGSVLGWFNQPFNLPVGMGSITLDNSKVTPKSGQIDSFEVLNYDGSYLTTGRFSATVGGAGRRRSVRRRRSSSRRRTVKKSNKTQKGRRIKSNRRSHHRR